MITQMALLCSPDLANLNCVLEGKQGKGYLYLSNIITAVNKSLIKQNNIKAIITVGKGCYLPYSKEEMPNYLYLPLEDKPAVNIGQHFERCFNFIEKNLAKHNVLVHCKAGVSRSVSIIASYLMIKFKYKLKEALKLILKIQPQAKPNPGFMIQLEKLNIELHGPSEKLIEQNKKQRVVTEEVEIKKKKHLCVAAKKLQRENKEIVQHIGEIKQLCQDNALRTRSKSQFLKRKLKEAREKRDSYSLFKNLK